MKTVGIEALVRWAYLEELPHGETEHVAPVGPRLAKPGWSNFAELMAVVDGPDVRNIYGLVPTGLAREPHPDAVAVFDAVTTLEGALCAAPPAWNPLGDMGDLGELGAAAVARGLARLTREGSASRLRRPVLALVMRHAITGAAPDWQVEKPQAMPVLTNGKPAWFRRLPVIEQGAFGPVTTQVEVDGYNARRQRPYPGAYRKAVLAPDPAPAVLARAEHELWHAALVHLARVLAPRLRAHEVQPPAFSARPWMAEAPNESALLRLVLIDGEKRNADAA